MEKFSLRKRADLRASVLNTLIKMVASRPKEWFYIALKGDIDDIKG